MPWAASTWHVGAVRAEQSLRECLCGFRRLHLELVVQDFGALVERADGARPVARISLQLHERPVSDLLQGLEAHPAPAVLNGLPNLTDVAPAGHHVVAEFDALPVQLIALG